MEGLCLFFVITGFPVSVAGFSLSKQADIRLGENRVFRRKIRDWGNCHSGHYFIRKMDIPIFS
jgi:hypothetical protein